MTPAPLDNTLTVLVDTAMIRPLDDREPAFLIKHALVQDTAQSTLLKNENKRLHLLVGFALEQVNASQLDEYAAELAFHFAQGEDDAKTLEYSLRAGDVAARVFANAEALEHYERAIEIACRQSAGAEQIVHLFARRGRILEITGRYHQALATYLELHDLAEQRDDRSLELASMMLRAPLHSAPLPTFDATLAKQLLLDALGTARELGDENAEARVLWNLTLLSVQTMQPADGLMYGELALSIAERLNLREQQAYTLHELFIPYRSAGQIARAHKVQAQARTIFRDTNNHVMLADSLGMSAQFTMYEGDLGHAFEYASEGVEISRMIDNPFGVGFNSIFLTLVYLERGEHSLVIQEARDRGPLFGGASVALNPIWLASIQSFVFALLGGAAESARLEDIARDPRWPALPPIFRSGRDGLLARVCIMRNDLEGAAADLARGLEGYEIGSVLHPGSIHIPAAQAELGLARGEYAQVLNDLQEQANWARVNEYALVLVENLLLQGRAYLGLQDFAQACVLLAEALSLAQAIGSRRLEYQIQFALSIAERHSGNGPQAEEHLARAHAHLKYILEHTPPEYREGFLKLPPVARVLNQHVSTYSQTYQDHP